MDSLTRVRSVAVVMPAANIDTDAIFPARFLLLTVRTGLGRHLFQDRRTLPDGGEDPDFPLNRPRSRDAQILVAGENFGCGSSREQAVWSLADGGFRVVIAPRFGDIFHANCLRNGVLAITLEPAIVDAIGAVAEGGGLLTVDLERQAIALPDGSEVAFMVEPNGRQALLHGWDETALILSRDLAAIASFESRQSVALPWLYETDAAGDVNDAR